MSLYGKGVGEGAVPTRPGNEILRTAKEDSELAVIARTLDSSLDSLSKAVSTLQERLIPLTTPQPPNRDNLAKPEHLHATSPFTEFLAGQTMRIQRATGELRDLLEILRV